MSQVSIELLISIIDGFYTDKSRIKVRKTIYTDNGTITRYGLSFVSGDWIRINEGDLYPEECIVIDHPALKNIKVNF